MISFNSLPTLFQKESDGLLASLLIVSKRISAQPPIFTLSSALECFTEGCTEEASPSIKNKQNECWCLIENSNNKISEEIKPMNLKWEVSDNTEDLNYIESDKKQARRYTKKRNLPRIDYKLKRLQNLISTGKINDLSLSKTKINGLYSNTSGRRSNYTSLNKL